MGLVTRNLGQLKEDTRRVASESRAITQPVRTDTRGGGAAGGNIAVRIVQVLRNHVVCSSNLTAPVAPEVEDPEAQVLVAKARAVRPPSGDTETRLSLPFVYTQYTGDWQARRSTQGTPSAPSNITELQRVLSPYVVGRELKAKKENGGTGVTEAPDWIDDDDDADRVWMEDISAS